MEISLSARRENGEMHAPITVRDHGKGVPEAVLAHLFRPCYRVALHKENFRIGISE